MASRVAHRLSARSVETIKTPGKHSDGNGLYLLIGKHSGRSWIFVYRSRAKGRVPAREVGEKPRPHRLCELGLGPAKGTGKPGLTLQEARSRAAEARKLLVEGKDPLAEKRKGAITSSAIQFGSFADKYVDSIAGDFKNDKSLAQWRMTLKEYAAPLRTKAINAINTEDVLQVLRPIWSEIPETASRLRGRIEKVLDAAKTEGLRDGENPARWRGHLDTVLRSTKKKSESHHAALPFEEMPGFMRELRSLESISAYALEFTILTAARTNETLGAKLAEIDRTKKIWTIPAERMKAGKSHEVPLCDRALALIEKMAPIHGDDTNAFLFGSKPDAGLSNMALLQCLRGLRDSVTVHGFRSTFRDWAGDATNFSREVIEAALAHQIKDKAEAAYRRSTALEKRRKLMATWEAFLGAKTGKVIPLGAKKANA